MIRVSNSKGTDSYPSNYNWVVDDNGTLHIRNPNHQIRASYSAGAWERVVREERTQLKEKSQ